MGMATRIRIQPPLCANNQITALVKHSLSLLYTDFPQECQKSCAGVVYNKIRCFPFSYFSPSPQNPTQPLLTQKSSVGFVICWALNFSRKIR